MNKAEEQYLYQRGWTKAKINLMEEWTYNKGNFIKSLKHYCVARLHKGDIIDKFTQGADDYIITIIHAIDGNVITDWPSFVTYMTGETYE